MADRAAIVAVQQQLTAPPHFMTVFGPLPSGDLAAKKAYLRKQYSALAAVVHPDRAEANDQALASTVFGMLTAFKQEAYSALEAGNYERALTLTSPQSPIFEVATPHRRYAFLANAFRVGDLSTLYRGYATDAPTIPLLAKVALEPRFNALLEREAQLLGKLRLRGVEPALVNLRPYLPEMVETVIMPGVGGTQFRVVITSFNPAMVSVADIMAAYPKGLIPPDAAWVGRRIIAQVLAARALGVVHGALTPNHVLVHPVSREPVHIGWAHAVTDRHLTHVIERWRELYPPEVFKKQEVDERTDVFMAGATIIRLLGGDVTKRSLPGAVPVALRSLLLRSLSPSPADRPESGQQFLADFTRIVRGEWGQTYRPLVLPVRNNA